MHHKLSVLVHVDLDGRHVRLAVAGCLTELSHRALCPLIRRARTVVPGMVVVVDVTAAHHVEDSAVDRLRRSTEHEDAVRGTPPVEFVVPAELPEHGTVTRLAAWTGTRGRAGVRPAVPLRPLPGNRLAG
ncbi:hypothetical protein [Kocuria rosea]|uniref:hypothetical protein n=1 Tax=Kocuria rosea TaxID=1275 RepID=UPI00203C2C42|nr:hypothetical protein [Kocuria rosea]MCM3688060.1 hypothetical protein [Kocuria rosea]